MKKSLMIIALTVTSVFAHDSDEVYENKGATSMIPSTAFEMKARPTDPSDFDEYVKYLVKVSAPRTQEQIKQDDDIKKRYSDHLIIDSLWVGGPGFPAGFSPEQYESATDHSIKHKYNVVSMTITNAGEPDTPEVVRKRMVDTNKHWQQRSEKYLQVLSYEDFDKAKKQGKLGVFHNFQGMMPLSQSGDETEAIKNLNEFYELGLRQLMFSYNIDTPYSDGGVSNSDGTDQGVHDVGFKIIAEANRLGIAIDCSHSSNETCVEAAQYSDQPIMLSHSNSHTFQPIDRNVSDKAIQAVAATGGVICINFIGGFLNPKGDASSYQIAKHAEYIKNLVGAEHVCAGSDYVWNYGDSLHWILNNPKDFPVEMGYATPSHMGKPSEMWGAARVLEEVYGWNHNEIAGFLGGNLERFYRQVWK